MEKTLGTGRLAVDWTPVEELGVEWSESDELEPSKEEGRGVTTG